MLSFSTSVLAVTRLPSSIAQVRSFKGGLLLTESIAMLTMSVVWATGGLWSTDLLHYNASLFFLTGLSGTSFATTLLATMVWFNVRNSFKKLSVASEKQFLQVHKRKIIAVVVAAIFLDVFGGVALVYFFPVRGPFERAHSRCFRLRDV